MHFRLKKTIAQVTVLTALLPVAALAAETTKILRDPSTAPARGRYVYDTGSRVVRTTVTHECVRDTYWTPAGATPECAPDLFGKFEGRPAVEPEKAAEAPPAPTEYEPAPYEEPPVTEAEPPEEEFQPVPPPVAEAEEPEESFEATRTFTEEQEAAPEEGVASQREFHDEGAGPEQDETFVPLPYAEEQEAPHEEGPVAQNQFYEEERKEPEDLISEPTIPQEEVAAAEEEKPFEPTPVQEEKAPMEEETFQPEPIVAEEEQAPETAIAEKEPTPVMLPVTVTLEAEPWFDFDRYAVRSDARDKLDKLVGDLQGVDYEQVVVVGHADRIGTPEYNQRLSERRAESVKRYLVGQGMEADKISTEGRGEFEPSLDPAVCQGMRKQKLIDCLQPDRRVEVTVTGSKPQ